MSTLAAMLEIRAGTSGDLLTTSRFAISATGYSPDSLGQVGSVRFRNIHASSVAEVTWDGQDTRLFGGGGVAIDTTFKPGKQMTAQITWDDGYAVTIWISTGYRPVDLPFGSAVTIVQAMALTTD